MDALILWTATISFVVGVLAMGPQFMKAMNDMDWRKVFVLSLLFVSFIFALMAAAAITLQTKGSTWHP